MYVFILQHFHCLWQNLSSLLPPIHSTTLWFLNHQQMQQDDSVNTFSIHCNNEKILSWFHNVDNNINNLADQRMVLVISIRLNNLMKTALWFPHNSVVYDWVKTGSSESQAEAKELNQSQSVGTCIVIGLSRVCKFYWWVESVWLLLHKFWSHFGIFGVKYQTFQHMVPVCIHHCEGYAK